MRRLYRLLTLAITANAGVFLGFCLWQVWHWRTHPEVYLVQSAPWYTSILLRAIAAGTAAVLLLAIRRIVKRHTVT